MCCPRQLLSGSMRAAELRERETARGKQVKAESMQCLCVNQPSAWPLGAFKPIGRLAASVSRDLLDVTRPKSQTDKQGQGKPKEGLRAQSATRAGDPEILQRQSTSAHLCVRHNTLCKSEYPHHDHRHCGGGGSHSPRLRHP